MPKTNDYTGHVVAGKLILGRCEASYEKSPKWKWRCLTCGHEGLSASWGNLRGLEKKGCTTCRNCMAPKLKTLPVGHRINSLEVTGPCRRNGRNPSGSSKREVPCRCVLCGNKGWWNKSNIQTGIANCACQQHVQQGLSNTRVGILWSRARKRAQDQDVPFSITHEDIVIPEFCPVLGIKLSHAQKDDGGFYDASPTLDKFIPTLGYVPGNVAVISMKANRLKSDGTTEELRAVANWMTEHEKGASSLAPPPFASPRSA